MKFHDDDGNELTPEQGGSGPDLRDDPTGRHQMSGEVPPAMSTRSDSKRKPAAKSKPTPWLKNAPLNWRTVPYVHGDGLQVMVGERIVELVPYVGPGSRGAPVGYAIEVDCARNGFTRVEGPLEKAVAVAELMLAEGAK
jgi:hypothetical protein